MTMHRLVLAGVDEEIESFAALVRSVSGSELDDRELRWVAHVLSQLGSHRWAAGMLSELCGLERVVAANEIDNALDVARELDADRGYRQWLGSMKRTGLVQWIERWARGFSVSGIDG